MTICSQELLQSLENDLLPEWQHFQGVLEMDVVKEFAERLYQLAVAHHANTLQRYADELRTAADHFQIDTLKNALQQLPSHIALLKNETSS